MLVIVGVHHGGCTPRCHHIMASRLVAMTRKMVEATKLMPATLCATASAMPGLSMVLASTPKIESSTAARPTRLAHTVRDDNRDLGSVTGLVSFLRPEGRLPGQCLGSFSSRSHACTPAPAKAGPSGQAFEEGQALAAEGLDQGARVGPVRGSQRGRIGKAGGGQTEAILQPEQGPSRPGIHRSIEDNEIEAGGQSSARTAFQ